MSLFESQIYYISVNEIAVTFYYRVEVKINSMIET